MITIAKLSESNYKQWSGELALLLEQEVVWGIIEGYDRKPPTLSTDATVTEIKAHQQNLNWPLEPLGGSGSSGVDVDRTRSVESSGASRSS